MDFNASPDPNYYFYHLRCGGELNPSPKLGEKLHFHQCLRCGDGGYPFIEEWVEEEGAA